MEKAERVEGTVNLKGVGGGGIFADAESAKQRLKKKVLEVQCVVNL